MLFFDTSGDVARRALSVSLNALAHRCSFSIRTDLLDQHCYVFDRNAVFQALENKPAIAAIKEVYQLQALQTFLSD